MLMSEELALSALSARLKSGQETEFKLELSSSAYLSGFSGGMAIPH